VGEQTIQRAFGSPEPKKAFQSKRFQECPDCVDALHGKAQHVGDHTAGVGVLQQALAEAGYRHLLPKTFAKGEPDKVWGEETSAAVRAFQTDHGVRPVGGLEAGPRTFTALDDFFGKKGAPGSEEFHIPRVFTLDPVKPPKLDGKRRVEDEGKTELKPSQEETAKGNEESTFQLVISGGVNLINVPWKFDLGKNQKITGCDSGQFQVGLKLNKSFLRLDSAGKWAAFAEPEIDMDIVPRICGKEPSFLLQGTIVKHVLSDAFELSLNGALGRQGPPIGWFGQAFVELDAKPFTALPAKITAQFGPQLLWVPENPGDPNTHWKATWIGTLGLKVELPSR
jgi:peptidoglycan hydrolase-like protein with peptidoglycan-binding domain